MTYTTWKNPSDQIFRHTKDLMQGCSHFKQKRVYQYYILLYSFVWKGKNKV